ncbi:MAG: GNAT family N-acetyltransferase [Spirochaetales bacterium]|nr:GNAT family N-acetyltransferase [Spirochaetales bacterium]
MKLRAFIEKDSEIVSSWISAEEELYKWSANILKTWPLTSDVLSSHYREGMTNKTIFPFVALDDNGKIFGHFFLRFPYEDKNIARIGFVILDPAVRGKGYGRKLIQLAEDHAKKEFGAKMLSLGVFSNNLAAMKCYLSMGFMPDGRILDFECPCGKWKVIEMMKDVSGKGVVYRKADKSDLKTIQSFVDNAKIVMESQGIPQWDEIYPTDFDFGGDVEKNELYLGEVEGKPAVCFTLNSWQDNDYLKVQWENPGDGFKVIHRLCVNPEFQGRGLGINTCRYIEGLAWVQGASSIKLDAFAQNPISLAMYEKLGYKVRGYADWRKGRFKLMEKLLKF